MMNGVFLAPKEPGKPFSPFSKFWSAIIFFEKKKQASIIRQTHMA